MIKAKLNSRRFYPIQIYLTYDVISFELVRLIRAQARNKCAINRFTQSIQRSSFIACFLKQTFDTIIACSTLLFNFELATDRSIIKYWLALATVTILNEIALRFKTLAFILLLNYNRRFRYNKVEFTVLI